MINCQPLKNAYIKAWPVRRTVGIIAACWILSYFLAPYLKEQILYSGTMLQVCGLWTVAEGIRRLRHDLVKPSMLEDIKNWFHLVVSAFREPQTIHVDDSISISSCESVEITLVESTSEMTTEMRLDALEKGLNDLREQQEKSVRDIKSDLSHVKSLVHDERNNRLTEDAKLLKTLENVAVGGIHLELVGLAWLLLGMLGTSIPKELTYLFWLV